MTGQLLFLASRPDRGLRSVFQLAVAMEYRADNPCDRLLPVLGPQHDVIEYRKALPHREVVAAIERVRAADPAKVDVLAFEFLVLTAARSGEVRGTVWSEIDREAGVWTVRPGAGDPRCGAEAGRRWEPDRVCQRAREVVGQRAADATAQEAPDRARRKALDSSGVRDPEHPVDDLRYLD